MVTISWDATLSSTKPGRRAKVEAQVRAADEDGEASAVVAEEAEVEAVAGEVVVEAGTAAIAVAAEVEIGAGKIQRNQMKFVPGNRPGSPVFLFYERMLCRELAEEYRSTLNPLFSVSRP